MKAPLLCLVAVLVSGTALAAPPPNADPSLAPWFRSLKSPVYDGMSCCAEADGHILRDGDWRIVGNRYEVKIHGKWRIVPPRAVLNRADNPTGGAVAFYPPGIRNPPIYCFVRPAES